MFRERALDLVVLVLNVFAILLLVGFLSIVVNGAEAGSESSQLERSVAEVVSYLTALF